MNEHDVIIPVYQIKSLFCILTSTPFSYTTLRSSRVAGFSGSLIVLIISVV